MDTSRHIQIERRRLSFPGILLLFGLFCAAQFQGQAVDAFTGKPAPSMFPSIPPVNNIPNTSSMPGVNLGISPTNNVPQQPMHSPSPYFPPTQADTHSYIDSHPALQSLPPYQKELIQNGAGNMFLSAPYLSNGLQNPFYQDGKIVSNWYLPSTWSSPTMNWKDVKPNGFLPTPSMATFYGRAQTTTYNPTINNQRIYTPPPPPSRPSVQQNPSTPRASNDSLQATTPRMIQPPALSTLGPSRGNLAKNTADRERALALSETAGDKVGQATNHAALAELFIRKGQMQLAFTHIRAAETIQATTADPSVHVGILRAKGAAYMSEGQFESAINAYQQALAVRPPAADEAEIQTSLGWAYQSAGDILQALKCYQQAQSLFAKAGENDGEVRTVLAIGSLYELIGEPNKAIEQYRNIALKASAEQFARMLVSTAEIYQSVNAHDKALVRYEKALALIDPPPKKPFPFPVFSPPSAIKSMEIDASEKVSLKISILAGMGRSHMALEQFEMAEHDFQKALAKAQELGNQAAEAGIVASIGELAYWKAITNVKLECHQISEFRACSWSKPDFSEALWNYHEALLLMQAAGNRIGEIGVLTNTGLVYDARDKRSDALRYYGQAIEKMDELETAARLEAFRIDIANQSAGLYQRAIELEARQHHMEQAFNLSERARARTLLDQLGNPRIGSGRDAPLNFLQREKELRQESIVLRRQLGQELAKAGPEVSPEKMQALQTRLAFVRTQYEDAVSQLKLSNPEYASFLSISPLMLREAQKQLAPDATLVSYFTTPQMTLAFVITRNSFHAEKLPVTSSRLSLAITTFLDFAGTGEDSSTLRFLYNSLIEPIKSKLNTAKLIVVPHGVLHDLPFAALTPDGKSYLNDHYAITYLPSVSILPYVRSRVKPASSKILVLANNQEEGVPQLNYAYREATWVASLFGTQPLLGAEATPVALRAKADEADIVHLIAHFDFDPENPLSTRVLLGRDKEHEETLDIGYITSLNLRHTSLVVLSGCQSHLGKRSRGDDVIGLSRAFMYAGSPSVIASLWSVDDDATEKLMIAFYTHLKAGLGKAESLRMAQADIRRQFPQPYYWAGFVLMGDPGEPSNPLQAKIMK
ncbi:MAG: CHAT domain-containing protein [Terriglobales bacterium]